VIEEEIGIEVVEVDHVIVIAIITIVTDEIADHHRTEDRQEHQGHVMTLMTVQNFE